MKKSIFIQIPCYRDIELNKTIQSAINNASGDYLLHFGVHNCYLTEQEAEIEYPKQELVKLSAIHSIAPKNMGAQKSRYLANTFFDNEDFYLQIDAHMRFAPNWDIKLVDELNYFLDNGIENPLLTGILANYMYETSNGITREIYTDTQSIPPIGYYFLDKDEMFKKYLLPNQQIFSHKNRYCTFSASVSAAFVFANGKFGLIEPHPELNFWNEEPITAMRAFTHGFDIVSSRLHVLWHLPSLNSKGFNIRNRAYSDFPVIWADHVDGESKNLFKNIITSNKIGRFELGSARSLEDWSTFSGLNYETGEINSPPWLV